MPTSGDYYAPVAAAKRTRTRPHPVVRPELRRAARKAERQNRRRGTRQR
jgi:hypothetical protein